MQKASAVSKNHVEAIKAEQDGLDVLGELPVYAREGFASVSPAAWERLKWYGVYVQRPREDMKLMLRIKLPGRAAGFLSRIIILESCVTCGDKN